MLLWKKVEGTKTQQEPLTAPWLVCWQSSRKKKKPNRLSKRPICRTPIRLGAKRMSRNPRKSLATPLVPRQLSTLHLCFHSSILTAVSSPSVYTTTGEPPIRPTDPKSQAFRFPLRLLLVSSSPFFCFRHWSPPQSNFKPLTPLLVPARPLPNLDPPARTRSFRFRW
ncbi:uncharacterized protein B0T23DRAFT_375947 [Neurospora hispaniola]|uniref:Uncharacterized protein n=1 Tax=Neurospora hispaniola TaxID=588809 RepID=A0AAJ0I8W2_9PEZI|nr:hypothetical protein B0T23DRAFT_375947 [Neurospora hispaniola]